MFSSKIRISKICLNSHSYLKVKPAYSQRRLFSLCRPLQQEAPIESRRPPDVDSIKVGRQHQPLITGRKLQFPKATVREPKQAWLETLETIEDEKLGIVDLHPEVFGQHPRLDVLHRNIVWQENYKKVDYRKVLTRAEVKGYKNKPWQQKGTGRARHGSRTSPLFIDGGAVSGPRGPKVNFYMLAMDLRVKGLCVALSCKFAQENLHIVESLNVPTDNPQTCDLQSSLVNDNWFDSCFKLSSKYIEDLIEARGWGLSVLFINETDTLPENMAFALEEIDQYNAMPVYGMNVFSMLKHETLVITLPALELIERKLLERIHVVGPPNKKTRPLS